MKITIEIKGELTRIDQLRVLEQNYWLILSELAGADENKKRTERALTFFDGNTKHRGAGHLKVRHHSAPPLGERTFRTISAKEEKKRAKEARKEAKSKK